MRLTCKIGKIEFDDGMPLSKAKLVRDTLMGQVLNPTDGIKIKNPRGALDFCRQSFPEDSAMILEVGLINGATGKIDVD